MFYSFSKQSLDSNYYINRDEDFIDEDSIFRALQYRYTYWPQPENVTTIRQKLIDVFIILCLPFLNIIELNEF
jgi:hypothetical protein